jgi:hypothetical protein
MQILSHFITEALVSTLAHCQITITVLATGGKYCKFAGVAFVLIGGYYCKVVQEQPLLLTLDTE